MSDSYENLNGTEKMGELMFDRALDRNSLIEMRDLYAKLAIAYELKLLRQHLERVA